MWRNHLIKVQKLQFRMKERVTWPKPSPNSKDCNRYKMTSTLIWVDSSLVNKILYTRSWRHWRMFHHILNWRSRLRYRKKWISQLPKQFVKWSLCVNLAWLFEMISKTWLRQRTGVSSHPSQIDLHLSCMSWGKSLYLKRHQGLLLVDHKTINHFNLQPHPKVRLQIFDHCLLMLLQ